jgi:hypothetical protein
MTLIHLLIRTITILIIQKKIKQRRYGRRFLFVCMKKIKKYLVVQKKVVPLQLDSQRGLIK